MITHFQYNSLYSNSQMPGWRISFYYKKKKLGAIYHPDGKIEWTSEPPLQEDEELLIKQIHELMLFHVYDK